jgi:aryl-alcohol dehydrogenase-like predicted oxidoreductase
MSVPRRGIGTTGPEVSVLALGSWHIYDRMPFREAIAMLRYAVDAGITLFDVGYYGGFSSAPSSLPPRPGQAADTSAVIAHGSLIQESYTDILFGQIVRAAGIPREDYQLSAKLWVNDYPKQSMEDQLDNLLLRVDTDRADFAILGDLFGLTLDYPQLVRDLDALVDKGKLGGWGVNHWSVADIRALHEAAEAAGVPGPQMAQLKYSVIRRSIPDGGPFLELVDDIGITLQASDVLEGGILAGNLEPTRVIGKDPGGIRERVVGAAIKLGDIASTMDTSAAQLAVAFCLTHPAITTVLFGASSLTQLKDNLGAIELAEKHGPEIRAAVAELWLDRDVVDPAGQR